MCLIRALIILFVLAAVAVGGIGSCVEKLNQQASAPHSAPPQR